MPWRLTRRSLPLPWLLLPRLTSGRHREVVPRPPAGPQFAFPVEPVRLASCAVPHGYPSRYKPPHGTVGSARGGVNESGLEGRYGGNWRLWDLQFPECEASACYLWSALRSLLSIAYGDIEEAGPRFRLTISRKAYRIMDFQLFCWCSCCGPFHLSHGMGVNPGSAGRNQSI